MGMNDVTVGYFEVRVCSKKVAPPAPWTWVESTNREMIKREKIVHLSSMNTVVLRVRRHREI